MDDGGAETPRVSEDTVDVRVEYENDEEYAARVGLPSLLDELVASLVRTRDDNPVRAIEAWARARRWGDDAPQTPPKAKPAAEDAPEVALFEVVEAALREHLEDGTAWVAHRKSEERSRQGVDLLLRAMAALRCVATYEIEVLYPAIDRECEHEAALHMLYQANDELLRRLAETRVLLPSLLEVSTDGVAPLYLADLRAFAKHYQLHSMHKQCVIRRCLHQMPAEQLRYTLQLVFASPADKAPLLACVVYHLANPNRPYPALHSFLSVVRRSCSNPAEYKRHFVPPTRRAAEQSPVHTNLLTEDGLL